MATKSPDQTRKPKGKTNDAGKGGARAHTAKSPLVPPANAVDVTADEAGAIYGFAFPMAPSSKKRVPTRGDS